MIRQNYLTQTKPERDGYRGRCGRMAVGFTTTHAISAYRH
jgi:hypothetical protein